MSQSVIIHPRSLQRQQNTRSLRSLLFADIRVIREIMVSMGQKKKIDKKCRRQKQEFPPEDRDKQLDRNEGRGHEGIARRARRDFLLKSKSLH